MATEDQPTQKREKSAGDYILGRKLGTGGFGSVFEARHKVTQLPYAVKRISLSVEDADRFNKEALYPARIAAKSMHVLTVISFFQDSEEDFFYLVTELIPHGDLRDFLERHKPLPVKQALEIGLGIARGLAAIHEQNIVHLDLKPRNVLMDQKDGRWVPKIADFGLARSAGSRGLSQSASVGYAAPEQLDWKAKPGPESDLFAFGMVLYELLTGKRPVETNDREEYQGWLEQRQKPPAPSQVRPELKRWGDLDVLMQELLEYDPDLRKASASEVVRTLGRVLREVEGERVPPPPPPPPQQPPSPERPRTATSSGLKYGIAAAVLIVLLGAGLLVGYLWQSGLSTQAVDATPETVVSERVALKSDEEKVIRVQVPEGKSEVRVEVTQFSGGNTILFLNEDDLNNYQQKRDWSFYTAFSDPWADKETEFDSGWLSLPAGSYAVLASGKHNEDPATESIATVRVQER